MNIVLIGSGNTATVLGRKIAAAGHRIIQVFSRKEEHAAALAAVWNCSHTHDWNRVTQDGDLYLIALADDALAGISAKLRLGNHLVVHTAGAIPLRVLEGVSRNYGVLYPLQSLRKELADIPVIPVLVDANTGDNLTLIGDFAQSFSSQVMPASDEQRLKLHLAAVLVNNFTNHLYVLAEDYCRKEKLRFDYLLPLIDETSRRLHILSPQAVQTGPAIRRDQETLQKHLQLLESHPQLKALYRVLTEDIRSFHFP